MVCSCWSYTTICKITAQFECVLHFFYYGWGWVSFHMYNNTSISITGGMLCHQIKSKFGYHSHSGYMGSLFWLINAVTISSCVQNVVQIYRAHGPNIFAQGINFTTRIVWEWVHKMNIKWNFTLLSLPSNVYNGTRK